LGGIFMPKNGEQKNNRKKKEINKVLDLHLYFCQAREK
jgi:hypothetical protein